MPHVIPASPEQARAARMYAGRRSRRGPDHPTTLEANQLWRAEMLKTAARAAVADWPPLTAEQLDAVRAILAGAATDAAA